MRAPTVHTNGKVFQGHQDHIKSGIAENLEEDQGNIVTLKVPAPAGVATFTGGPFFQATRFLRTLSDRLFGAPPANREPNEEPGPDYSYFGSCCG